MGFGEMLTLVHVEKSACFANINLAKMQQMKFSCSSFFGHRQAVPLAVADEVFCSLCVPCIHSLSCFTLLLPRGTPCFHISGQLTLSSQSGREALFSPLVRNLRGSETLFLAGIT